MANIITRQTQAPEGQPQVTVAEVPLSNTQLDNNFINLNTELSQKLPLTGGTLTGSRTITFDTTGGDIEIKGDSGGWATGLYFVGSEGTFYGGYGALGGGNSFANFWIGPAYNDNWITFSSTEIESKKPFQLAGNSLKFDEIGIRSWSVTATGGNLDVASGDGSGLLRYNGHTIINSNNYNNYALPLSGGTLTGAVTLNNNLTVSGTTYYTFNKPSTSGYQTVALFGSASGGLFLTSDNAIISKGAYYNNGWIATDTSGSLIDFTLSNGPGIATFTGATVGQDPGLSSSYTILHVGNYNSYALPLSGGTLTGKVILGAAGTAGDPALRLNLSNSGSFVHGQEIIAPSLTTDQAVISIIGYSASTKNSGYIGYKYSGTSGSNSNLLTFGHWGSDHLVTIDGIGNTSVTGNILPGGYLRMGTFSNSVVNTGEAWIGRATDRSTGTMTVQLGNDAARVFEVVDHAWSQVIFDVGMNAINYKGNSILHAGNYNNYAPTLTGGGASGTWGISVTGNSATVGNLTPAQFFNNMGNNHGTYTDFNTIPGFGTYYVQAGTNGPTGVGAHQWYGFTIGLGNEYSLSQYASQLYWPREAQNSETYLYLRDREGGTWGSWRKIRAGYSDSAGTATDSTKLPLTGGTLSGQLDFSNIPSRYTLAKTIDPRGVWDGSLNGYLLLAKAYVTGLQNNSEVTGTVYLSRGDTGSGRRTETIEIFSKSAYNSENFLVNWPGGRDFTAGTLHKVTYGGVVYHAIRLSQTGGGPYQGFSFSGYTTNAGLVVALDSEVTDVTSYGNMGYYVDTSGSLSLGAGLYTPTMWVNYSPSNFNGYNENIRLYPANNGVAVIAFGAASGSTTGSPWNSVLGYSDRLEIRQADQWQLRSYAGYVEAYGSLRSPIFYDTDDTGYYVDPRSTSILSGLRLNGVDNNASGGDYILWINKPNANDWGVAITGQYDYNYLYDSAASHSYGVRGLAAGSEYWRVGTDLLYHNTSIRAPIFYDTDNTAYYTDPASASVFNDIRAAKLYIQRASPSGAQAINSAASVVIDNTDNNFIQFRNSADNNSYQGLLFSDNNQGGYVVFGNAGGAGDMLRLGGYNSISFDVGYEDSTSSVALRTQRGYIDVNAHMYAFGSMRAPIFYDYNDTGYYLDPTSTSKIINLTVGTWSNNQSYPGIIITGDTTYNYNFLNGSWSGSITAGFLANCLDQWEFAIHDSGERVVSPFLFDGGTGAHRLLMGRDIGWGTTYIEAANSFRAPIFYDSNDTSYYLDPSSTTTSLQVAGTIEQGNNYAHPNIEWSASGDSSGMVVFYLPGTTANYGMVHMVFDLYEYNGNAVSTVTVGGHNWQPSWYNVSCDVVGWTPHQVRLGVKDGRFVVVFGTSGTVWHYGTIRLRKIHNGSFYNNVMDLGGNWSAVQTTTESFTSVTSDLRQLRTPATLTAGGYVTGSRLWTGYDSGEANSVNASNWFRSSGSTGWYNATYGGGIYMEDGTWVRVYNNKQFYSANIIETGTDVRSPIYYDSNDTGWYVNPNSLSKLVSIAQNYHTLDVPGSKDGSYKWVRFSAGIFNGGGSPITFSISRSINDNDNAPYGGCTAVFTVTGREWHSGQENVSYFYTEHGANNAANYPNGYYITHLGYRDLSGGGNWIYMRLLSGVRYKMAVSADMNFNGNVIGGPEYDVGDPGSVPVVKLGFGVFGGNNSYSRIQSRTVQAQNITSAVHSLTSSYYGGGTTPSTGYLITTNINYNSFNMPTVIIEGYAYGNAATIHLEIVWYAYNNSWTSHCYTNLGGWDPGTVSLGEDGNGKVCIHLSNNIYYGRFNVRCIHDNGSTTLEDWSITEAGTGGLSKVVTVSRSSTKGNINAPDSVYAPIFYDNNDTNYYLDPNSSSRLNTVNADTLRSYNNIYLDNQYGSSIVGVYSSYRYQGVFAMGDAYKLALDGTGTGTLYGLAWSHPNAGGVAANLNTHGLLAMENGGWLASLSGSIRSRDDMRTPIYYDNNDTGYYLDPNSTSNSALRIRGGTLHGPNPTWGAYLYVGTDGRVGTNATVAVTNGNLHIDAQDGYDIYLNNYNGRWTRAPGFYDNDDTGYYLDMNSTSRLNRVDFNNLYYYADTNYGFLGTSIYVDTVNSGAAGDPLELIYVRGNEVRIGPNGGDKPIKAATYYDYADTNYYLDPNSDSVLYRTSTHLAGKNVNSDWNAAFTNTPTSSYTFHGDISSGGPSGSWWFYESMRHSNSSNYWGTQIAWGWEDNANELRQRNVSGGSWSGWVRYVNSNNATSMYPRIDGSNLMYYAGFTLDADTMPTNSTGFTYSVNAPHTGPIADFSTGGSYDLQLNAPYGNSNNIAFRTRNGDAGTWNTWRGIVTDLYNSSLNSDSRNSRGVTRLYRRDDDSDYSVQTYWTGSYWRLYGYNGDTAHADTHVGYADSAGYASTAGSAPANGGTSSAVTINYNNDSDSTYQMLWGSGNSVYGTGNIYCNPSSDALYAAVFYDASDTDGVIDPAGHSRLKTAGSVSTGNQSALEIKNTGGTGEGDVAAISWHCANYYGLQMHLRHDGYFGIGGWSASTWRWYVNNTNGDMTAAGNVTAYSDPRLKEDVQPITDAVSKIKALNGVKFRWKDTSVVGNPGGYDYGVLAPEVEKVLPELVHSSVHISPDGDPYKTVAYDKLAAVLIEAVKEQQTQIEELKALVKTLLNSQK